MEPEGGGEGHGLPGLGPGESSRLGVRGGESVRVGKQGDGGDEVSAFERHDAQTTLALSVGVFVERMVGVGMEMRAFLEEGFSASDRGGDVDARVGLEKYDFLSNSCFGTPVGRSGMGRHRCGLREVEADDGSGGCSLRLGARRENRAVTELEEMLMPMPLSLEGGESGRVEGVVPRTGWEVRGLDRGCSLFAFPLLFNVLPASTLSHLPIASLDPAC